MQCGPRDWGFSSPRSQELRVTLDHPTWQEGALSVQISLAAKHVCSQTFLFTPPKHLRHGLISMSALSRKAVLVFESPSWEPAGVWGSSEGVCRRGRGLLCFSPPMLPWLPSPSWESTCKKQKQPAFLQHWLSPVGI